MPDQYASSGAQSKPDRGFLALVAGAGKQHAGQIHTGYQQHQTRNAEHHSDEPDDGIPQERSQQPRRSERNLHTAVVLRIHLRQLPSDRVESRLSLQHGDAWLQTPHREKAAVGAAVQIAAAALQLLLHGYGDENVRSHEKLGTVEPFRSYAQYRELPAVD